MPKSGESKYRAKIIGRNKLYFLKLWKVISKCLMENPDHVLWRYAKTKHNNTLYLGSTCEVRGYYSTAQAIESFWSFKSWEECSVKCQENSLCTHWSWHAKPESKQCKTKIGSFGPFASSLSIAGYPGCTPGNIFIF